MKGWRKSAMEQYRPSEFLLRTLDALLNKVDQITGSGEPRTSITDRLRSLRNLLVNLCGFGFCIYVYTKRFFFLPRIPGMSNLVSDDESRELTEDEANTAALAVERYLLARGWIPAEIRPIMTELALHLQEGVTGGSGGSAGTGDGTMNPDEGHAGDEGHEGREGDEDHEGDEGPPTKTMKIKK